MIRISIASEGSGTSALYKYKLIIMPIANNLLTGGIIAPFITILAGVSLATLQRSIEWISSIAKTPQKLVQTIQMTP